MNNAPVVLFVYNRPEHTQKTLEALSEAKLADESILYIYSDGAKAGASEHELRQIQEVRSVIRSKRWCNEVHIVEAEKNLGLADSIVTGVTEVVDRHGRMIVLEDDIVISKGFLAYCNDALEVYKDDDEVMHVAGCMYDADFNSESDTFFLKVMQCHGWATWKRAWDHYNNDALDHLAYFQSDPERCSAFDADGTAYFMKQMRRNVSGELKTWAVRWYASWLRAGGISLFPSRSLVRNIGFDDTGENCGSGQSYMAPAVDHLTVTRQPIQENIQIRAATAEFWRKYLKRPVPHTPRWRQFLSRVVTPALRIGTRVTRRLMMALFPELKPLLLAQDRLGWSSVVTALKGSSIHDTAKLINPVHLSWCRVGKRTYIGPHAHISYTEVGNFCSIGPNFKCGWGIHPVDGVSTSPSFYSSNPTNGFKLCDESKVVERKKITIGNDVFIGMNATVLDGVTIGDGAVIGAGCVVSKDVPPYAVAVGCPIKILRYRFDEQTRNKLLSIKWWDWPENELREVEKHFFQIDDFAREHERG